MQGWRLAQTLPYMKRQPAAAAVAAFASAELTAEASLPWAAGPLPEAPPAGRAAAASAAAQG